MDTWQKILQASITRPAQITPRFGIDPTPLDAVADQYPMRITPYYLSLIREVNDPIWRQAVPDAAELHDSICVTDPLDEENQSPVPNLVHRYPDRALFLVCAECAMYCRFCTRKRKVGTSAMHRETGRQRLAAALAYLRRTPAIHDVLVSGGDPLLLPDEELSWLLTQLRAIPHLEIIRIGSRVPCTLPQRVTVKLARLLKQFHPLYLNTHFNHPRELTPLAAQACARLADAGIPLGNQTVLLKGVNDNPAVIRELMRGLVRIRVKPYYLFQADLTQGTDHFRTPVETGLAIMKSLIGHTSGLATPTFALDAPGGGGKIPLAPAYVDSLGSTLRFTTYQGTPCSYPNPE